MCVNIAGAKRYSRPRGFNIAGASDPRRPRRSDTSARLVFNTCIPLEHSSAQFVPCANLDVTGYQFLGRLIVPINTLKKLREVSVVNR